MTLWGRRLPILHLPILRLRWRGRSKDRVNVVARGASRHQHVRCARESPLPPRTRSRIAPPSSKASAATDCAAVASEQLLCYPSPPPLLRPLSGELAAGSPLFLLLDLAAGSPLFLQWERAAGSPLFLLWERASFLSSSGVLAFFSFCSFFPMARLRWWRN